jgi:hypothetical protein
MKRFEDNILAFTDEEALNQELNRDKWEVIKKVWGTTADSSSTPPIIGMTASDEDDGTVNLDVTDCSTLCVFSWQVFYGFFSESPETIGVNTGVGAKTYNIGNMIRQNAYWSKHPVPKGAKYFNYRMHNYGTTDSVYAILVLKV